MGVVTAVLLGMGGVSLLIIVIAWVVLWSPERAAAVNFAETGSREQIKQILAMLYMRHREIVKRPRLDRHPAYIWPVASLWFLGLGILLAPARGSIITELSWDAQKALGACIFIGSTVAVIGILFGAHLPAGHRIGGRSITDNLLSELLGDDVRMPYTFGWLGLMSIGVGMVGYAWTIFEYSTLIGTLAGALTFGLGGMCAHLVFLFMGRTREHSRWRNFLLAEIAARMEQVDP
jgi:hypothetical protein